ncbi:membrane protein, partial [Agrobacterium tumefaciens]
MSTTQNALVLVARILLSFMFILAGFGKLTDPAGTAGMIAGAGLPAATALSYLAGAFELVAGLAVLVGF